MTELGPQEHLHQMNATEREMPHVYLVAGGGGGMQSTIILRLLAQELSRRELGYSVIEGMYLDRDGVQKIRHPSLQATVLEDDIATLPEASPVLLIPHCIGTVAAMNVMERHADERPVGLVSIAPPLPSPRSTIAQPQSIAKRFMDNSLMRVVALPEGALDYSEYTESFADIDPQYFKDMNNAESLGARLRERVAQGQAGLFAPEHDWNTGSPDCVKGWHDEWHATLPAEEASMLRQRTPVVKDAAHGLYISPRSVDGPIPLEDDIAFQMHNVRRVINTGLELIMNQQPLDILPKVSIDRS